MYPAYIIIYCDFLYLEPGFPVFQIDYKEAFSLKRICCLLLLCVPLLLSSCALIPQEEALPEMPLIKEVSEYTLETVAVERGDLIEEKIFTVNYRPVNSADLSFPQSGQAIAAVYVQLGDTVQEGDLLAELDNTATLQAIDAQQHTVDSLNLQIRQQQQTISLQKERIATLKALAQTDSSYASKVTSAEQSLKSGNKQLEYLYALLEVEKVSLNELYETLKSRQLYASMDGTLNYALSLGSSTVYTHGQTICSIQDLTEACFTAVMSEPYLKEGDPVTIQTGNRDLESVVKTIELSEDQRNYHLTFALTNPDPSLKAGTQGRFTLVINHLKDTLYLPARAVHSQNDAYYVYYQNDAGLVAAKEVKVGPTIQNKIQIISGLEEGDLVIV